MPSIKDLHPYQLHCVEHIKRQPYSALFLDMGLGKTVSTLTALQQLLDDELCISRVLIVAPRRVAEHTWTDELDKWEHLRGLRASRIIGTAAERSRAAQADAELYIVSRDNVKWLVTQYGKRWRWDALVIDELSSFKSHSSQRFKALRQVRQHFRRIVGLTGTPSPNGYMDLWAQLFLIDGGDRLGRTISAYRNSYFAPAKYIGHIIASYRLKAGADAVIQERLSDICISMTKEDYLSLPECLYIDHKVKLSDSDYRRYKRFERDQVLQLEREGDIISASSAAALCGALAQFASGAIYDDEHNAQELHTAKLDTLIELVESATSPVLIAYHYRHERWRLLSALRAYGVRELSSEADLRAWNAGDIPVLIGHPASMGHGLNIQSGGNTIIWFGLTWSLELYQQFNARLYRQGQTKPVIIHRLLVSDTIDERIAQSLESKDDLQRGVMNATRAILANYSSDK